MWKNGGAGLARPGARCPWDSHARIGLRRSVVPLNLPSKPVAAFTCSCVYQSPIASPPILGSHSPTLLAPTAPSRLPPNAAQICQSRLLTFLLLPTRQIWCQCSQNIVKASRGTCKKITLALSACTINLKPPRHVDWNTTELFVHLERCVFTPPSATYRLGGIHEKLRVGCWAQHRLIATRSFLREAKSLPTASIHSHLLPSVQAIGSETLGSQRVKGTAPPISSWT